MTEASEKPQESAIPCSREDLLRRLLKDRRLNAGKRKEFRQLCDILQAFFHYSYHSKLETLKQSFAPFSPDADPRKLPAGADVRGFEQTLFDELHTVLRRANYSELSGSDLATAFAEESLIHLRTEVDFNDFDRYLCFYRGRSSRSISERRWFFWKRERRVQIFERLVLMLNFASAARFTARNKDTDNTKFQPGKTYLYYYKNVPRHDLEILFPNLETRMTLKDLLLFAVPALGAAVWMLIKALPQLLLIAAAILFFMAGPAVLEFLGIAEYRIDSVIPVLVAFFTILFAAGGLALRQYGNYKRKIIEFQKNVTDTLFFRSLAVNQSVLHSLVDECEEEVTKEILLVYFHLWLSHEALSAEELDGVIEAWLLDQLDGVIEAWLLDQFGVVVDFDIQSPLAELKALRARSGGKATAVLSSVRGKLKILPPARGRKIIDALWDKVF